MRGNRAQVQFSVWLVAILVLTLVLSPALPGALAAGADAGAREANAAPHLINKERAKAHGSFQMASASIPLPPRPKPPPNGGITTQGVRLSTRLSEDAPSIGAGVRWIVTATTGDSQSIESSDAYPAIELEPGIYRARAIVGLVKAETEFTIAEDEVKHVHLPINAGKLEISIATGGAKLTLDKALIELRADNGSATKANNGPGAAGNQSDQAAPLMTVHGGELQAVLPAGAYVADASIGTVTTSERIVIEAGVTSKTTIDLEVGYIVAEALAAEGTEPLTSAVFSLRGTRDGSGNEDVLARTGGRHGIFTVAPGQYRLGAEFGLASGEQLVRVGANRLTSVSITLDAARLELDTVSPDTGTGLGAGAPAQYRVFRAGADGGIEPIVEIESARPLLRLPAGEFTIEAERQGLIARQSIALNPGEPGSLRMVLNGGLLNVAATALGKPIEPSAIQLSVTPIAPDGTDSGPPLGLGPMSDQPFTLPAGRYRLAGRIEPGGALAENIFVLNAGGEQSTTLDFRIGEARVQVLGKAKGKVLENAYIAVERIDSGDIFKVIGGKSEIRLAPGNYKVVAGSGTRRAEGELTVVAGNLAELVLVPK